MYKPYLFCVHSCCEQKSRSKGAVTLRSDSKGAVTLRCIASTYVSVCLRYANVMHARYL